MIEDVKEIVGDGYAYLAYPWKNIPKKEKAAYRNHILDIGKEYMNKGINLYNPVPIGEYTRPDNIVDWEHVEMDKPFVMHASALILLPIKGWENSIGMKRETTWAHKYKVRIFVSSYFISLKYLSDVIRPPYAYEKDWSSIREVLFNHNLLP